MAIKQLAYKYPCYPNKQQEEQLELEFAAARAVYNWGLATRKGVWEKEKRGISARSKPDGLQRRLVKTLIICCLDKPSDRAQRISSPAMSCSNRSSSSFFVIVFPQFK